MLITFELDRNSTLYDFKLLLYAFRPIVGLKLEKEHPACAGRFRSIMSK